MPACLCLQDGTCLGRVEWCACSWVACIRTSGRMDIRRHRLCITTCITIYVRFGVCVLGLGYVGILWDSTGLESCFLAILLCVPAWCARVGSSKAPCPNGCAARRYPATTVTTQNQKISAQRYIWLLNKSWKSITTVRIHVLQVPTNRGNIMLTGNV